MSYEDVSQMIRIELDQPIVNRDKKLKLWYLAAKGYVDLEVNTASSKESWLQVRELAKSISSQDWEERAEGELGIITFLEGDSKRAARMLGDALISALATGDVGAKLDILKW
jgi:hypothetical protein